MANKEWINSVDELPTAGQLCDVKMILSFRGYHLADVALENWIPEEEKQKLTPEMVFWRPYNEKKKDKND